jgi:hypothetical protein
MHCGTTVDAFLRENLDWLKKATNWAKFSATAGGWGGGWVGKWGWGGGVVGRKSAIGLGFAQVHSCPPCSTHPVAFVAPASNGDRSSCRTELSEL